MNQSETNLDLAPDTSVEELREELQALRKLIVGVLLVLIVMGFCLNVFLMKQASMVNNQVVEVQKVVTEYQTVSAPIAQAFWVKLVDYSKTHPDFNPIISKYAPYIKMNGPMQAPKK